MIANVICISMATFAKAHTPTRCMHKIHISLHMHSAQGMRMLHLYDHVILCGPCEEYINKHATIMLSLHIVIRRPE